MDMQFTLKTFDGSAHELKITMADMIRYDVLRARYNFPKQEEGTFIFMALLAYSAMVRSGKIPATTKPDDFFETIETIEAANEDSEDDSKSV